MATVLDVDGATTVITRVAEPVGYASGSPPAPDAADVVGRLDVLGGTAARVGFRSGSAVERRGDEGGAVWVVKALVVGLLGTVGA